MQKFFFKASDENGKIISEYAFSESKETLENELKERNYCVYKIKKVFSFDLNLFSKNSISTSEMVIFNKQLSILIKSGLPIVECIEIIKNQTKNIYFKKILVELEISIKEGYSLSQSMAKYPNVFKAFYCNSVASGEKSGALDEILMRMIKYFSRIQRLRSKIVSSIVYPLLLILVAISLVTFLLTVVIPEFSSIFKDLNGKLPWTTTFLINISNLLKENFLIIFSCLLIFIYLSVMYFSSKPGKILLDIIKLKFPYLGKTYRKYLLSQFSITLSTMLSAGIPMINSIELVIRSIDNSIFSDELKNIVPSISSGEKLTISLKRIETIPDMVIQMVSVGERTGAIEEMLSSVSEYYEEEIDNSITNILTLIEPILMIFMGGIIGFIVISMFLPIIKMSTLIN